MGGMQNRGGSPPTVREKSQTLPLGPGEMALPPWRKVRFAFWVALSGAVVGRDQLGATRNLQFLENYVGRNSARTNQGAKEWALAMLSAEPGIKLSEIF